MRPCPRVQPCCSLLFRWLTNRTYRTRRLRDADRLDPEELLDPEPTALLAHARDADASEGSLDTQVGGPVDEHLAGDKLFGDAKTPGEVLCLDVARQAIARVVGDADRLLLVG